MSALGLGVFFVLSFTLGISWLVWSFDARMGRSRLVRLLPLPLDNLSTSIGHGTRSGLKPLMAIVGFMLVFFAAMVASFLGRLATMQPAEAAVVFETYPLIQILWRLIMGCGPIACVVMAVPGTYFISNGLGAGNR